MTNNIPIILQEVSPVSIIDATQLPTPLPILSLKKSIAYCKANDIIQINIIDNDISEDIESFCNKSKNLYLGKKNNKKYISCFVQKK